jgi:hypothetical protein
MSYIYLINSHAQLLPLFKYLSPTLQVTSLSLRKQRIEHKDN